MSQKPVIYLGNLNVVRDSHRVHLLILHDDPDLYDPSQNFSTRQMGLNEKIEKNIGEAQFKDISNAYEVP